MRRIRVGVIGTGQMGSKHAKVYASLPYTELMAVADPVQEKATMLARELKVPYVFSDFEKLLAIEEIEAVSICTPDELHREPVVKALQAGKHVLVEKPLATTIEDCEAIVKAVKESTRKCMVAHLLRFDPRYIAVKRALDAGELGDVIYVVSHRNSPYTEGPRIYKPGTCLTMHVAIHDIDIINWFVKSKVTQVYSMATNKLLAYKNMLDAVVAILKFSNEAIASINYSWCLPSTSVTRLDARMEVVGTAGAAYIGSYHGQGVLITSEKTGLNSPDLHHAPVFETVKGDLREEIMAFINCIMYDLPSPIPVEEAFYAVRVAAAIRDALSTGMPVNLTA